MNGKNKIIREALIRNDMRFLVSGTDAVWENFGWSYSGCGGYYRRELQIQFTPITAKERVRKLLDLAVGLHEAEKQQKAPECLPKVEKLVDNMLAAVESVLLRELENAAKDGCDNNK